MSYYSDKWGKTQICVCSKTAEPIYFGDFVKGVTENGIEFSDVQMNEIGGGALGVWVAGEFNSLLENFGHKAYELHGENGGIKIASIELVRHATDLEKGHLAPFNEKIVYAKPLS